MMNIHPTQSSQIPNAEPPIYSSGVEDNLSSLEDLEGDSSSTLSTSSSPSSPEPPMTPWTTSGQPKAKRRKITDPVDDQCLKAVKALTDMLNKNTKDDFCAHFAKNVECWMRSFPPDVRGIVAHKVNMVLGELALQYEVKL
ncbi:uncharacterized protein LOC122262300 [Penaeus japonicus]|uniref:uncharacterized protein LOC122262300 n=1 Tax=Penaeus japonicus TaxID=27405 RepID=UPI001C70E909|nr:uncharacterized protein LOC122262300 [Penaeus japonicus]